MREQELEMLQREKEAEHFKTWEEQEDNFHLQQAKLRCGGVLSLIPSSGAQTHGARACPRAFALVHAAWNLWPEPLPFTLWVSAYCLLGKPPPTPFLAPAPALCAHLLLVCPVSPVGPGAEETPESTCAMGPRCTR